MKVLFLQVNNPGIVFYRMYQFAQKMSALELAHCRMFPPWDAKKLFGYDWESNIKGYMATIEPMVEWSDVVVCQYIHSADGLTIVQAIRDMRPCLMEIDDYFSQVPHYSVAYDDNRPGDRQDFWATRQAIESTGIVTSTSYLKDYFIKLNKKVEVIPNCIDFELWDSYKKHSNEKIRIGWIGGATHEGDLKMVKDVIYEVLNKFPNTEFYIVSYPPPDWKLVDRLHLIQNWSTIDLYAKTVKDYSFDIGLAPLRDNHFNRGKSNLKYLEYSTCHTPTIASRVEPFLTNFEGRLANDDESWFNHLSDLIENQDLRLNEGMNAYFDVKDNFNLTNISMQYAKYLERYC